MHISEAQIVLLVNAAVPLATRGAHRLRHGPQLGHIYYAWLGLVLRPADI